MSLFFLCQAKEHDDADKDGCNSRDAKDDPDTGSERGCRCDADRDQECPDKDCDDRYHDWFCDKKFLQTVLIR